MVTSRHNASGSMGDDPTSTTLVQPSDACPGVRWRPEDRLPHNRWVNVDSSSLTPDDRNPHYHGCYAMAAASTDQPKVDTASPDAAPLDGNLRPLDRLSSPQPLISLSQCSVAFPGDLMPADIHIPTCITSASLAYAVPPSYIIPTDQKPVPDPTLTDDILDERPPAEPPPSSCQGQTDFSVRVPKTTKLHDNPPPSPHGYSWFDGLLRNPRSGVQIPQVLGYSPIRAALILGSGVQNPYEGLGSHRVHW
jgi:hypothetical protein